MPSSSPPPTAPLASSCLAANTSLKRSRQLFATPVLPLVERDKDVVKNRVAHLIAKRYHFVDEESSDGNKKVSKITIAVPDPTTQSSSSSTTTTTDSSVALIITQQQTASSNLSLSSSNSSTTPNTHSSTLSLPPKRPSTTAAPIPVPTWHPKWKISTVLSSHLGWVRSIAFDPSNEFFVTGSSDRTIKVWDTAQSSIGSTSALKLTLTGHKNAVRGLAISDRHPYMFSCGEDKMVKCWDLEYNKVIRDYHGHLSGVYCLKLHPTLDVLVTGGRDACARVWDMRTKNQVHCLTGHEATVGTVICNSVDPQVVTGSQDSTVKLWDLAAGKVISTLTNHKKSIRSIVRAPHEFSYVSGGADNVKKWEGKTGRFIFNMHNVGNSVINAMACNTDGVLVSGSDNGEMNFWDYETGYNFQRTETIVQPGSLDAEKGVFAMEFDVTGTRLVTGEADKSIKIWKEDKDSNEIEDPVDMERWRREVIKERKGRF